MTDRPILFKGPLVRAILDGRKTVTRRLVKTEPSVDGVTRLVRVQRGEHRGACVYLDSTGVPGLSWCPYSGASLQPYPDVAATCPFGVPGDRLWVRETWRTAAKLDGKSPTVIGESATEAGYSTPWAPVEYVADGTRRNWEADVWGDAGQTRVSIHMPRWASRLTLEVTNVRVERLQDITEDDARAEGVDLATLSCIGDDQPIIGESRWRTKGSHPNTLAFAVLWDTINEGPASWQSNPWVWRVEFRRVVELAEAAE